MLKIKYLISCNDKFPIKAKAITTDYELALINSVSKVFSSIHLVGCLFHFKQALIRKLNEFGLYKAEYDKETDRILSLCGSLPFLPSKKKK